MKKWLVLFLSLVLCFIVICLSCCAEEPAFAESYSILVDNIEAIPTPSPSETPQDVSDAEWEIT